MIRLALALAILLSPTLAHAETLETLTGSVLEKGGPWGLLAIAFGVIVVLWRDANTLRAQLSGLNEKRAEEAKSLAIETSKGLANSSVTSAAQATAIDRSNVLLQQMLDVVRSTPAQHEALGKMLDRNYDEMKVVTDVVRAALKEMREAQS